jgi:RNA polymerase sigma-70 factor (ECF subfamily)
MVPTPGDPADRADERWDLLRALATLPIGQREALILTEWIGLDSAEAGTALGLQPASVRSRVSRARAALREQLGGTDG